MTWPQDAYVGQKVVCIDGSATSRLFYVRNGGNVQVEYLHELAEGGIYTVSCVTPPSPMHGRSYIGVHVAEVDRPAEMPFHHKRFRPVENAARRTDAAVQKIISDALKAPARVGGGGGRSMSDAVIHKIDHGGVCVIGHGQRVILEFWLDSRKSGEYPLRIEMSPVEVLGLIGLAAPAAKAAMLAGLK